ncbi:hypothetical protein C8035_v008421 [Colletotrichum spinosum]|uniref:Endonuclease/exonuclease/phosphatase domain-containing protein n=1 Tax=Colletotrichum spinosum TaxID=1347390 RepID=A0A4R8QBA2_9PEZI|nr:hypothetical protein C8035_v008421 [Colletotrichum spinosum]
MSWLPKLGKTVSSSRAMSEQDLEVCRQSWHHFNKATLAWEAVAGAAEVNRPCGQPQEDCKLTLATWNVDAFGALSGPRLLSIISRMVDHAPSPDVVFLQEVSKTMLPALLEDERVRQGWYSSEKDVANWRGQLFATVTLMSKSRFGHLGGDALGVLGSVSRVKFRTRYGRDALCGEVFLPLSGDSGSPLAYKKVRFVNVHLDSLAVVPSRRPHQLSVVASLLHETGSGLVAGDFNPVLPEDDALIEENRLVDAWKALRGDEPGYTWGIDGKEPFPANRLDRVAMVGLRPLDMEVMHPGEMEVPDEDSIEEKMVRWSDHSGLKCTFLVE